MYNFDFSNFAEKMLPPHWRKPIMTAWVKTLMAPLTTLWADLVVYRQAMLDSVQDNIVIQTIQYRLRLNYPQVGSYKCYVLTNYDSRPLSYIHQKEDVHKQQEFYIYSAAEGQPPFYIYSAPEYEPLFQYKVIMPTAYTPQEAAIRLYLNQYRPAGKNYELIFQDI